MLLTFSLIFATFLINFARLAKCNVDNVSTKYYDEGETFAIKAVLELPPREFFRRKVNLESLYLMCFYLEVFD